MVLYLELFAELSDHLIIQIGTVVCNNPLRDAISTDQVVPNEPCHNSLGYRSIGWPLLCIFSETLFLKENRQKQ